MAVAETSGFTAAAKKLGVSTSHVSRQVAALEERLGTSLLARTTRKVRLTEAGQGYYRRCQEIVDGLLEANEGLQTEQIQLTGTLKVSAAGEFAVQYIAPKLLEFSLLHPELQIDLNFNSRVVDFIEEGIDFAIRYGRLNDSGLIARKLATRRLVAVASPAYIKARGRPDHPLDLKSHSCLIANNDRWLFQDQGKPLEVKVTGRLRCNEVRPLLQACQAGVGICYLPRSSLGSEFTKGQIVEVLEAYSHRDATSWIVYANRKFLPAKARKAIHFLLESFKDWEE